MLTDPRYLQALVEAAIFASPEPVTARQLAQALGESEEQIEHLLEEINTQYQEPEHGIFLRKTAGGYQLATKPEHHKNLTAVVHGLRPRLSLSLPALQTLAIIAYKQPISAPEIQAIRRVEGAGVLQTLLKRKLIAPAGYRNDAGQALLYKTTSYFLKEFGLADLRQLPNLKRFASVYSTE